MATSLELTGGDLTINNSGNLSLVEGLVELRQEITTKLRSVRGEWFLDTTFGLPYKERILKLGVERQTVKGIFDAEIMSNPDVVRITKSEAFLDTKARKFVYLALISTVYGEMEIISDATNN